MSISDHTRRALWGTSGGVCARCKNTLIEEATEVDREALVGDEAHIVSRAATGPRHGAEPKGGFDGLQNLILLCQVCHAIVDRQPSTYSAEALREMRDRHVKWVKERTGPVHTPSRLRFTPIPAGLELKLIASGRELVDLLSNAEDVAFRHDQPRNDVDATLMSEFVQRVMEADDDLHMVGAHRAVDLSHSFQALLLEQLLPQGIIVLGVRAGRTVMVDDRSSPWTTCVLSIRYAPRTGEAHGSDTTLPSEGAQDLAVELQRLLAEGRSLRNRARISEDGSSALIELWERDVERALAANGRQDFVERFDRAGRPDASRWISGPWATKRRLDRELDTLASFLS